MQIAFSPVLRISIFSTVCCRLLRSRIRHVKLSKHVARGESHLGQVCRVPRRHDDSSVKGLVLQFVHHARQLVYALACVVGLCVLVLGTKVPPLETVHGPKVASLPVRQAYAVEEFSGTIAIPDLDASFREREGGGICRNEPEKFGNDGPGENAFSGEERKDRFVVTVQREFETLWSEYTKGTCASALLKVSVTDRRCKICSRTRMRGCFYRSGLCSPSSRISLTRSRYWYSSWRLFAIFSERERCFV